MKPRILILGAQHGDERLGPRLQRFLHNNTTDHYVTVDYLTGNPRALRRNVRFTETDLNRSFDASSAKSYEEKRAWHILRFIQVGEYDYVLDIHTSRADVGKFLLATHLDGNVGRVISASRYTRVAIMPPDIANCSLIGNVPNAISIEYDRRLTYEKESLEDLIELLDNLLAGWNLPREREIFYVADKIPLDSPIDFTAKNFTLCPQGFYPVIFAKNSSYTAHKGFAATKREFKTI